jgi:hypothetical protein
LVHRGEPKLVSLRRVLWGLGIGLFGRWVLVRAGAPGADAGVGPCASGVGEMVLTRKVLGLDGPVIADFGS